MADDGFIMMLVRMKGGRVHLLSSLVGHHLGD